MTVVVCPDGRCLATVDRAERTAAVVRSYVHTLQPQQRPPQNQPPQQQQHPPQQHQTQHHPPLVLVAASLQCLHRRSTAERLASLCSLITNGSSSGSRHIHRFQLQQQTQQHINRIIAEIERDHIQIIRRIVMPADPRIADRLEDVVLATTERIRNFLAACLVIGSIAPSSLDTVVATGDYMAAWILSGLLCSRGLEAKVLETDNLGDAYYDGPIDTMFFNTVRANISSALDAFSLNFPDTIPILPGSFGPLPPQTSFYTTLGPTYHTVLASLIPNTSSLHLIHVHLKAIHTADPRVIPTARQLTLLSGSEAMDMADVIGIGRGCFDGNECIWIRGLFEDGHGLYLDVKKGDHENMFGHSGGGGTLILGDALLSRYTQQHVKNIVNGSVQSSEDNPGRFIADFDSTSHPESENRQHGATAVIYQKGGIAIVTVESDGNKCVIDRDRRGGQLSSFLGHIFHIIEECHVQLLGVVSSARRVSLCISDDAGWGLPPRRLSESELVIDNSTKTSIQMKQALWDASGWDGKIVHLSSMTDWIGGSGRPGESKLFLVLKRLESIPGITVKLYRNRSLIKIIGRQKPRDYSSNNTSQSSTLASIDAKSSFISSRSPSSLTSADSSSTSPSSQRHQVVGKVQDAMVSHGIPIDMCSLGSVGFGISLAIREEHTIDAIRAIHDSLF